MHKVLLTGSNGFIGAELYQQLQAQNIKIRTLDRSNNSLSEDNWLVDLAADSCPTGICRGIDTLFHLAGKAHALSETSQDEAVYTQVNTEGTRKLLEAAQKAGVKRFVFFSSVKAVGDSPLQIAMDETFDLPAGTPYGRSKYAAEQLVLHGGYVPHPVVIRPCMVYGNTTKGNLPKMIKAIRRGLFPPLPDFHNSRSMVHVEDVVSAALLAAENPKAAGQIYIVSDQQDYSTYQLYNWIRQALGKPPIKWTIPLSLLIGLAKIGDMIGRFSGRRFIFDSDALQKLKGSACYSSVKINRQLGFQPKHSLQQALPDIIRYLT